MKTLRIILLLGIALWMMAVAATPTSLYVDPRNIEAISFPAVRIVTTDGSLVPEDFHVLCEWDVKDVCVAQTSTYVNEERMKCYASDPSLIIASATVNCSYVPSKDERAVVVETIEQDSCFVTIAVLPYEPPNLNRVATAESRLWLPRPTIPATPPPPPPTSTYLRRMSLYQTPLSKRQIVQYEFPKQHRILCDFAEKTKIPIQSVMEAIRNEPQSKKEQDERDSRIIMILALCLSIPLGLIIACCDGGTLKLTFRLLQVTGRLFKITMVFVVCIVIALLVTVFILAALKVILFGP